MTDERFRGSHETSKKVIFLAIVFIGIGIWENHGISSDVLNGIVIVLAAICFSYIAELLTFSSIEDKKILKSRFDFGRLKIVYIANITKIDRGAVFKFKSWGSRMEIYSIDERGGEAKVRAIQESAYSGETIQKLVARLKELNPNINLDPQYQDLIDGKIDPKKFKKIDPTHH